MTLKEYFINFWNESSKMLNFTNVHQDNIWGDILVWMYQTRKKNGKIETPLEYITDIFEGYYCYPQIKEMWDKLYKGVYLQQLGFNISSKNNS